MASDRTDPSQNNPNPTHEQSQPAPERYIYPPLHSSIEVNFPRRIEEKYEANQRKQEARDKWKVRLEIGTAIFIGATVAVNSCMLNEMKKTTEATKLSADAATASVQAWIVPSDRSYRGIDSENRVIFEFDFKNVGKTSALDVGFGVTFDFYEGETVTTPLTYQPYECPEIRSRSGVLPSEPGGKYEVVTSSKSYTKARLDMLSKKKAHIFIHGCVTYRDALSEREHITEIGVVYFGGDELHPFIPKATQPEGPFAIVSEYNHMK